MPNFQIIKQQETYSETEGELDSLFVATRMAHISVDLVFCQPKLSLVASELLTFGNTEWPPQGDISNPKDKGSVNQFAGNK